MGSSRPVCACVAGTVRRTVVDAIDRALVFVLWSRWRSVVRRSCPLVQLRLCRRHARWNDWALLAIVDLGLMIWFDARGIIRRDLVPRMWELVETSSNCCLQQR